MKKISLFCIIILIIGIITVDAQDNEKVSFFAISPGYAIFNNGDQQGVALSNDYVRNINSHLTYGARLMFAHGEGGVEGLKPWHDIHISTTTLDISGFYKPFKSLKHVLLLGVGISIDYTQTSYVSNKDYVVVDDKIYTLADTDATISLLEAVFDIRYYYNFKNNMFCGINASAKDFDFYQYIIGIGGGVRF